MANTLVDVKQNATWSFHYRRGAFLRRSLASSHAGDFAQLPPIVRGVPNIAPYSFSQRERFPKFQVLTLQKSQRFKGQPKWESFLQALSAHKEHEVILKREQMRDKCLERAIVCSNMLKSRQVTSLEAALKTKSFTLDPIPMNHRHFTGTGTVKEKP